MEGDGLFHWPRTADVCTNLDSPPQRQILQVKKYKADISSKMERSSVQAKKSQKSQVFLVPFVGTKNGLGLASTGSSGWFYQEVLLPARADMVAMA